MQVGRATSALALMIYLSVHVTTCYSSSSFSFSSKHVLVNTTDFNIEGKIPKLQQ